MFESECEGWWADLPPAVEPPADEDVFDPRTGLPFTRPEHGWLFGSMTERLEWLCDRPPSAVTWTALEAMRREPMSADERMLYAKAWDRQVAAARRGWPTPR